MQIDMLCRWFLVDTYEYVQNQKLLHGNVIHAVKEIPHHTSGKPIKHFEEIRKETARS